ncbi:MAG: M20/M25/M40 family metallo-hydrolase, partial [Gemmatimonadaceae bacterium]
GYIKPMRTFHTRRGLAAFPLVCGIALGSLSLGAQKAPVASLNVHEKALVRAVDTHNAAAVALLISVVNINSGSLNLAGVRKVGDLFRAQYDSLGFTTRWVDGSGFQRAGHLVAEHPGTGPKLLLIGHLDTVFEPTSPFQQFKMLNDSTATGPGVIDMKGGDVIALYALRALKQAGLLDRMNITVVYNGDEEESGTPLSLARKTLIDAAKGATAAIGFEDGAGDPRTAVISRRGDDGWILRTTGVPAHSSQIFTPDVGAGAVYEAARILDQFYQKLSQERYLTFNPGFALGGTDVKPDTTGTEGSGAGKANVVAKEMFVSVDLRTLSPEQLASSRKAMREIVANHLPHTTADIKFEDGYPPMAPTDGNRKLLSIYDQVSKDLGYGPVVAVDPSRAGAADVSFVANLVPMAIDGLGLSGRDDHTVNETANLHMLPVVTKRVAVLLYRLGNP